VAKTPERMRELRRHMIGFGPGTVNVKLRGGPDARINVRLPKALRVSLEIEARSQKHSLNTEIVRRLRESLLARDEPPRLIAKALLSGLDGAIVQEMLDIVMRDHAQEELAEMQREEEQIERGLREEGEE